MRRILLQILILTIFISSIFPTLPYGSLKEDNLINNDTQIIASPGTASFENGVFTQSNLNGEHPAFFVTPALINQFVFSGDITILEYKEGSSAASGVRFTLGYNEYKDENANDKLDYLNLLLTRHPGVSIERKGTSPKSDVYPFTVKNELGNRMEEGSSFHFEIRKQGRYISIDVDGMEILNTVIPDGYDFFNPFSDINIGIYTSNCMLEAKNLVLKNQTSRLFNKENVDFQSLNLGTLPAGIYDDWKIEWPSTNKSTIEVDNGTKYFRGEGYIQSVYTLPLGENYRMDMDMVASSVMENIGLFARSSNDRFLANSTSAPSAEFFEADSEGSIAGTGIFLKPLHGDKAVQIHIKQRDPLAAKGLRSQAVNINIAHILGADTQASKIINYALEDMGSYINVLVEGVLIAKIELSKETITYPSFNQIGSRGASKETYLANAKIKDAQGNLLLNVDNTLVNADYGKAGFGTRGINNHVKVYKLGLKLLGNDLAHNYIGSQIRSVLVPYLNKEGEIEEDDLRQGLRFCFNLPAIGSEIVTSTKTYTVLEGRGAIVATKANAGDLANFTHDSIGGKILLQEELINIEIDGVEYDSAYIYNIPSDYKGELIVARAFVEVEDDDGNISYLYSDVLEESVEGVYSKLLARGASVSEEVEGWMS